MLREVSGELALEELGAMHTVAAAPVGTLPGPGTRPSLVVNRAA
jgi:hypothetical protein